MAYRQNPWVRERGLGAKTKLTALKDGVDLKKVDGTVMRKGEVREYDFNILDAARTSTARSVLSSYIGMGLISVNITPTRAPRPKKQQAKDKPYVPRDWPPRADEEDDLSSDEPVAENPDVAARDALDEALQRLQSERPSPPAPKPVDPTTTSDEDESSSSYMVMVESSSSDTAVQPELNDDSSSSSGEDEDEEEFSDRVAELLAGLREKLLAIKGVSARMADQIMELGEWNRRNVESVKFMKSDNVGTIVKILEEYRSKLESI